MASIEARMISVRALSTVDSNVARGSQGSASPFQYDSLGERPVISKTRIKMS